MSELPRVPNDAGESAAVATLTRSEPSRLLSSMKNQRITRPCWSCGGKRTCRWAEDAWCCTRCGDEWEDDAYAAEFGLLPEEGA